MADELQKLYEDFRRDLEKPSIASYYDENDIVDIFDYAGDVHDDYVRLEALMFGLKFFPDSEALAKRKVIYYSTISDEAFRACMANTKVNLSDPLWAILAARAKMPSGEEAQQALKSIVELQLDEDEEIIQFVALAYQLREEQWLIDNIYFIRGNCKYDRTLMFEIARRAESRSQIEYAITLLEELTMDDPFNLEYWTLLADLQCSLERYDEALNSLDYAKAINPTDSELLTLEGYVKIKCGHPEEAINVLQEALAVDDSYATAKYNLLDAARAVGNAEIYRQMLAELSEADAADTGLMLEVLNVFPEKFTEVLERYYLITGPDESGMLQNLSQLCTMGRADTALAYMKWYKNRYSVSQNGEFTFVNLIYLNGNYKEALDALNSIESPELKPQDMPILSVIASIYLKMHLFEETLTFCNSWIKSIQASDAIDGSYKLVNLGVLKSLIDIRDLLVSIPNPNDTQIDSVTI